MHVIFLCWGNICRSPMAERVARKLAADRGLDVVFTSAATSTEELGAPIDRRAAAVLTEAGYDADHHVAHQISRNEAEQADLIVAMEQLHLDRLRRIAPGVRGVLMSDYDPQARPGDEVPDPWYGPDSGFRTTLHTLQRAVPHLLDELAASPAR